MEYCTSHGYNGCHIEDRQGDACFAKTVEDFGAMWGTSHWDTYCDLPTPKSWYMTTDASNARYTLSFTKPNYCTDCYLYDINGMRCPCKGPSDMRCKLQACLQYQEDWCWATSVAIVSGYYLPGMYPNGGPGGPNCHGFECKIVGSKFFPSDPNRCCEDKDSCSTGSGGTGTDIINGLTQYTGLSWSYVPPAKITQEFFERVLSDRNVMVMGVAWAEGSGHVMVVGGTDGQGTFYLHDPYNIKGKGSFQSLSWKELVNYNQTYYGKIHHGTMNQAYVPSSFMEP